MDDDGLYLAWRLGRWSFQLPAAPPAQPNLYANLLTTRVEAHQARRWTVTLIGFQYSGGDLNPGLPPDNQTDTSVHFQAQVVWGVDGALETAVVDYRCRGCTFSVHAANLQLSIASGISGSSIPPFPTLAGFLSPSGRGHDRDPPTLTLDVINLGPGGAVFVPVPRRAIAYSLLAGLLPDANMIAASQFDGHTNFIVFDFFYPTLVATATPEGLATNKSSFVRLHPATQLIKIDNQGPGNTNNVRLMFQLDLG